MGLAEDLERAQGDRPDPVLVDVAIGGALYQIEVRRLDGMEWALVMAESPPTAETLRLGYSPPRAALIACSRHGKLLDADGNRVTTLGVDDDGNPIPLDWAAIFTAISGVEIQAIAASWWGLNVGDPNEHVVQLKKASAGGSRKR